MSTDIYNVTETRIDPDVECNIRMLMLPMRDGVKLQTQIAFPVDMPEKAPVVLIRTPYCRRTWFELPDAVALKRGCVFIMQAVRGTAFSKGEFLPEDAELQLKQLCLHQMEHDLLPSHTLRYQENRYRFFHLQSHF